MHAFYGTRSQSLSGKMVSSINWTTDAGLVWSEYGSAVRVSRNPSNLSCDVVTVGVLTHDVIALASISKGQVIMGGTAGGMHLVWTHVNGLWSMQSSSERLHSAVVLICVDPTGEHYCVLYDTGRVEIRIGNGNLLSSWTSACPLSAIAWLLDGQSLLVGTMGVNQVQVLDLAGANIGFIPIACLDMNSAFPNIVAIDVTCVSETVHPVLVAFANGRAQLSSMDACIQPILLDTQCSLISSKWSPDGSLVVLYGERGLQFYAGEDGRFMYALGGPAASISCLAWNPTGDSLALVSGAYIFQVHIARKSEHCVFGSWSCVQTAASTVCMSQRTAPGHSEILIGTIKFIRGNSLAGCVVVTKEQDWFWATFIDLLGFVEDVFALEMQVVGCDIQETGKLILTDGRSILTAWRQTRDDGSEFLYHASCTVIGLAKTDLDAIVDLACSGLRIAIARDSGLVQIVSFLNEEYRIVENILVETVPRWVLWNCDGSRLALIDVAGAAWVSKAVDPTFERLINRDNVVDFLWASDSPDMFVCIDKQRLFVMRATSSSFKAEEPISGLCTLIRLENLEVFVHPPQRFPTKALRDMRNMLALVDNAEDQLQYAAEINHPIIWDLLAHSLLMNWAESHKASSISLARQSFDNSRNMEGTKLMNKLASLSEETEIVMEILIYYREFDRCEEFLVNKGSISLLVGMYKRTELWEKLERLEAPNGLVDMDEVNLKLAERHWANEEWEQAVTYFEKSGDIGEKYIEALVQSNSYQTLTKLIDKISDQRLLNELGRVFTYSGMAEAAVKAYMKIQKRSAALEVCDRLGRAELATKNNLN